MSSTTTTTPPCVLVFRKRLLAYSETFIADQGRHLPHWQAIFTGITSDPSGQHLFRPEDRQSLLSAHCGWLPAGLAGGAFKRFGLVPGPWQRSLAAAQPRLLHAHFGPDGLAAIPLARRLGIPLVTTFHGFDICIDRPLNRYRRNRHRVFAAATRVIAVSRFIADKLIAAGCPADKIDHHHIGIDLERFTPGSTERQDILFIGRLVEKKGCRYLVEAMDKLQNTAHNLQIIGNGPLRDELQGMVERHGLGQRVHFLGSKTPDQVRQHLASAAVLCVPSITGANGDAEGLGMVFLEAQAMGTPVVSTTSGGIPEAVRDGETGLLVPEAKAEPLAAALDEILADSSRAADLGRAGIAHVRRSFDVRSQCGLLEDIYDHACRQV